jgi:hypothetical protein
MVEKACGRGQGPSTGKTCQTVNAQSCRFTRDRPTRGPRAPRIRGGRDHSNSRKSRPPHLVLLDHRPHSASPAPRRAAHRRPRPCREPESWAPGEITAHHFPYTWRPTLSPRNNAVESNVQAYPHTLSSPVPPCTEVYSHSAHPVVHKKRRCETGKSQGLRGKIFKSNSGLRFPARSRAFSRLNSRRGSEGEGAATSPIPPRLPLHGAARCRPLEGGSRSPAEGASRPL